jgi:hypothetical protein
MHCALIFLLESPSVGQRFKQCVRLDYLIADPVFRRCVRAHSVHHDEVLVRIIRQSINHFRLSKQVLLLSFVVRWSHIQIKRQLFKLIHHFGQLLLPCHVLGVASLMLQDQRVKLGKDLL